jgi:hypothetical protein
MNEHMARESEIDKIIYWILKELTRNMTRINYFSNKTFSVPLGNHLDPYLFIEARAFYCISAGP